MATLDDRARAEIRKELEQLDGCLALARSRAAGEVEGLFGPDSAMWRYTREVALPMVGMRAVMLQIAHPAVASAGVRNSRFREEFLPRAWRTFSSMYCIQFGTLEEALRSARRVHAMHCRVRGTVLPEASEASAGAQYRANDPGLLRWVLATMIDSGVLAFDLLLEPLAHAERERFYQDMRLLGLVLGLADEDMPPTFAEFSRYFDRMLVSDELEVGSVALELGHFLFNKGWSAGQLDEVWAAGLLPERFRDAYRLPWSRSRRFLFDRMRGQLRRTLRRLPSGLRYVPAYHQGSMRVALARGEKPTATARVVNKLDSWRDLPLSLEPIRDPGPVEV
jgi:uncharacterized protein (DUF2236 family)